MENEYMKTSMQCKKNSSMVGIGLLGCGHHCLGAHAESLLKDKRVRIGHAYDPLPSSIAALNALKTVSAAGSEKDLLSKELDAVFIMTPDELHADSLREAVRAGKHVFVEKPLAVSLAQLEIVKEALEEAKRKGLVISSCHPRRFDPPFVWLKKKLPRLIEALGEVQLFEFDFSYHTPYKEWKHTRGLLIDHANHEIDLVNWYFGASSFKATRLLDTPMAYHVTGVRRDGIRFSFNGTRKLATRVYRESVRIRFDKGELILCATNGEAIIVNHESKKQLRIKVPKTDHEARTAAVNENFVGAVRGEVQNYLTPEDILTNTAFGVMLTEQETWQQ
jgi:predicted dehydrogenase